MDDRLPAALEASSLVRRAEVEGGFGMIVAKGDADRGALVLLIAHRGVHVACLERSFGAGGIYAWQKVVPIWRGAETIRLVKKARDFDIS